MKYLVVSVLFSFLAITALAQKPYSLKSHKMTVEGTSSMHDWTSDVTKLEWSGNILLEGNAVKEIKDVEVKIQVASIKSTKGDTMDEKTYVAFKSDKNPTITYKLSGVAVNGANVKAKGTLTMAGTTKTIEMNTTAKVLENGDVQFTGVQKLNMKDYKMTPPKAVLGTIKVGPEVTIKFDLTLTSSK